MARRLRLPRLSRILRKGRVPIVLATALAVGLAVGSEWFREAAGRIEARSLDVRFGLRGPQPAHPQVAVVGVLNVSPKPSDFRPAELVAAEALRLMCEREFPWSRKVFAELLDRLFAEGARAVAFDFVFPAAKEGDDELRAALERHRGRVLLGWSLEEQMPDPSRRMLNFLHPSPTVLPGEAGEWTGFVFYHPDEDGAVRRADDRTSELREQMHGAGFAPEDCDRASFPARAVELATGHAPGMAFSRLIDFQGPARTYPHLPIEEVFLAPGARTLRPFASPAAFRDKLVFVGPIANIFHDTLRTPFGDMPGVEVHAQVAADLLAGARLRDASPAANRAIAWACVALAALAALLERRALRQAALLAIFGLGFAAAAQALFARSHLAIEVIPPLAGLAGTGALGLLFHFALEQFERARIRAVLDKYVSANVASIVVENSDSFEAALRGDKKCVSVLFSDIRGFTSMTETSDAVQLVGQLNEYFLPMVDAVLREGGTLQKFIGDAIMAVWGDTHSLGLEEDATRAVRTALQMRAALARLNAEWNGKPSRLQLASGIGINHGEVVVGEIGHPQRMEFTVLGDGVNLAARLESATKQFHCDILVGEQAEALTRDAFVYRRVDRLRFKGKTQPVDVFIPLSERSTAAPPWLEAYHAAVAQYRGRQFAEAVAAFRAADTQLGGGDFLCAMYAARCGQFALGPPGDDWDGSHTLTEK